MCYTLASSGGGGEEGGELRDHIGCLCRIESVPSNSLILLFDSYTRDCKSQCYVLAVLQYYCMY